MYNFLLLKLDKSKSKQLGIYRIVHWGEFSQPGKFVHIQNFTFKCNFPRIRIQYVEVPMPAQIFKSSDWSML